MEHMQERSVLADIRGEGAHLAGKRDAAVLAAATLHTSLSLQYGWLRKEVGATAVWNWGGTGREPVKRGKLSYAGLRTGSSFLGETRPRF